MAEREFPMQTTGEIRENLLTYVSQSAPAQSMAIRLDDPTCAALANRIVDVLLAANDGIDEYIVHKITTAPSSKRSQRIRGWKKQLRKVVSAYMSALYVELDVADVFIKSNFQPVDCQTVADNSDAVVRACAKARQLARARSKLYGFVYFRLSA